MKSRVNEVQKNIENSSQNATPPPKKIIQGSFNAPRESLSQTTKSNNSTFPPKPPEISLADPSIINMIRQTCIKLACKDILEINEVVCKFDARPLIKINSSPVMKDKWLFDTGAGLTCMSTHKFKLIPEEKRLTKLILNQREARVVSETILIAQLEERSLSVMKDLGSNIGMDICSFRYRSVI
jgi:hypothetical protein